MVYDTIIQYIIAYSGTQPDHHHHSEIKSKDTFNFKNLKTERKQTYFILVTYFGEFVIHRFSSWLPQGSLFMVMLFYNKSFNYNYLVHFWRNGCPRIGYYDVGWRHSHWQNSVWIESSWTKWTTFINNIGGGVVRGGGGQGMGWTVCSSEILGKSVHVIYSNISWKEHAVLALSDLQLSLRRAASGKEFPISLASQVSHKIPPPSGHNINFWYKHCSSWVPFHFICMSRRSDSLMSLCLNFNAIPNAFFLLSYELTWIIYAWFQPPFTPMVALLFSSSSFYCCVSKFWRIIPTKVDDLCK